MATTAVSMDPPGLGPKKTFLVMVTVVGCIAILWPKVFYPMMFGVQQKPIIKDHRNNGPGCCEVVLDQDSQFSNVSHIIGQPAFRKRLNLLTGEYSIRQERPPHLRVDGIHPAMRERGRAIPNAPTVPIVSDRSHKPPTVAPRVIEGRPGPIPGMRPPMGAGSVHQATQKGNSMGFIMPLYTIGIVAFFVYTVIKLIFKKSNTTLYDEPKKPNPEFTNQVFGQDKLGGTITNLGWKEHDTKWHNVGNGTHNHHNHQLTTKNSVDSPLIAANTNASNAVQSSQPSDTELAQKLRETEQLLEISLLKKKLKETEKAMSKIIAEMSTIPKTQTTHESNGTIQNGHAIVSKENNNLKDQTQPNTNEFIKQEQLASVDAVPSNKKYDIIKRDHSSDRSVKVLGMEMTTSCEGGKKWNVSVPMTEKKHFADESDTETEPQSIFLEGSLPHESQILVSDSETTAEEIFDEELNGTDTEPAVVLSSKMTLSLINLDPIEKLRGYDTDNTQKDVDDEELISEEEVDNDDEEEEEEEEEIEEVEEEKDDKKTDINTEKSLIQNGYSE